MNLWKDIAKTQPAIQDGDPVAVLESLDSQVHLLPFPLSNEMLKRVAEIVGVPARVERKLLVFDHALSPEQVAQIERLMQSVFLQ